MTVGTVALGSRAVIRQYPGHGVRGAVAFKNLLQQGGQLLQRQRFNGLYASVGFRHAVRSNRVVIVVGNYPAMTDICQLLT